MSQSIVAKRYARAFFDLALERSQLDTVAADLQGIAALLDQQEDFAGFIHNPVIPTEQRQHILREIFQGKIQEGTLEFLQFLGQKSRLDLLAEVCGAFEVLLQDHHNQLQVTVTSAVALTSAQGQAIKEKLAKRHGKTIELTVKENPALIGGFQIRIGDQVTDTSISTKLETFRRNVLNA